MPLMACVLAAGQPIIAEPRVVEKLKEQGHVVLNLMDAYRTKVTGGRHGHRASE